MGAALNTDLLAQAVTTDGLNSFLTSEVVVTVIIVAAIFALIQAFRGNFKKAMTIVGALFIGLFVLGLATIPGMAEGVGQWAARLVTG